MLAQLAQAQSGTESLSAQPRVARVTWKNETPVTRRRGLRLPRLRRRGDEKIEALVRSGWFLELRRSEIELLARAAELVNVSAGEVVAIDADARRWWWLPLDGRLRGTSGERLAFVLAPGRGCGVAGPWRAAPRVTLNAVDDTRVLVADRRQLLGAMDESPAIARAVERSVAWAHQRGGLHGSGHSAPRAACPSSA